MSDKNLIRRNLVVGCGLSGAVVARRLAEELGEQVVAIDQKSQVGGLCFDFVESNGCRIQK